MTPDKRLAAVGRIAAAAGRPYSQQSQDDGSNTAEDGLDRAEEDPHEGFVSGDHAIEGVDCDGQEFVVDLQDKSKPEQRYWSRRSIWNEAESELLIAVRACNLSFSSIRDLHFRRWTTQGISGRFRRLEKIPQWRARYEEVLSMEEKKRFAVVLDAVAAVVLRRSQWAQEGQAGAGVGGELLMVEPANGDFKENNTDPDEAPRTADDDDQGTVHDGRPRGRKAWSDSESELLVALRACGMSYPTIRRRHFPEWKSSSGLHGKLSTLKEQSQWQTRFTKVQRLSEIEQRAVVEGAAAVVHHVRNQRFRQGQDEEEDIEVVAHGVVGTAGVKDVDAAEDNSHVDDTAGDEVTDGNSTHNEDAYQISEPTVTRKGRRGGRKGVPVQHHWDDVVESELLVALRACGLPYSRIAERDFPGWSATGQGLKLKLDKIRRIERWEARFMAIQSMDESEQLATIALAQEAVVRARGRRAWAELLIQPGDDATADADAGGVDVDELAKDGYSEIEDRTAAPNGNPVTTATSHFVEKDVCEIPDSPDPEMARAAPVQTEKTVDLGEDDGKGEYEHYIDSTLEVDNSKQDIDPTRSYRDIDLPARNRNGEQQRGLFG